MTDQSARDDTQPRPDALRRWVLYLLCGPAARLGVQFGLSLRDLLEVMQLAIYRAVRDEGWSQQEAADHLAVSVRTIAELSRATKESFLHVENAFELPRRIEFMLWAQPLGTQRLIQALRGVEVERVETVLAQLEAEGRIVGEGPPSRRRYRVTREMSVHPADSTLARLDALKRFMGGVRRTVEARFFGERSPWAGAMNVDFRLRARDRDKLATYQAVLLDLIRGLDRDARAEEVDASGEETCSLSWSMFWNPTSDEPD